MKKVLVATEKPFAPVAVQSIKEVVDNAGYEFALLENYVDNQQLLDAVSDADGVIIRSDKITEEVISAGNNLKIVVRAGAGYDNVDLDAASAKGVVVMNTPGQNANAVAELAMGLMVFLGRGGFNGKPGTELKGKTLGIHAYGNIGRCIARIANGFGMTVLAFDPFVEKIIMENDGVKAVDSVDELYSACQYVSINIPANDKTKNSINYDLLTKMPENAVLVNTARKEVIDEEGLKKVFADRTDFSYLSDIAPDCAEDLAYQYSGRFFFTPKKMGAQTAEANINAGIAAAKQIVNLFENNDTTYQVNK